MPTTGYWLIDVILFVILLIIVYRLAIALIAKL